MKRLNLFLKGNIDLHDSLQACRIGGIVRWNGINECLRATHPGILARVKHETYSRSDALCVCTGDIPDFLAQRQLELGAYSLSTQFSDALFTADADAFILSIQGDVTASLYKHTLSGTLLYPSEAETWSQEDRAWLKRDFTRLGLISVEAFMISFRRVIDRIQAHSTAPIVVFNLSSVIPGDHTHCYIGLDETYVNRIRRFNLALVELSQETGISIVDVDAILARAGADKLKIDAVHLEPEAYPLLAQETIRVLEDLGVFDVAIPMKAEG